MKGSHTKKSPKGSEMNKRKLDKPIVGVSMCEMPTEDNRIFQNQNKAENQASLGVFYNNFMQKTVDSSNKSRKKEVVTPKSRKSDKNNKSFLEKASTIN